MPKLVLLLLSVISVFVCMSPDWNCIVQVVVWETEEVVVQKKVVPSGQRVLCDCS